MVAGADQDMAQAALAADGAASAKVPLMQVKKDPQQKWLLAPHQWKLLLMHILPKSKDPEADGGPDDKFSFGTY